MEQKRMDLHDYTRKTKKVVMLADSETGEQIRKLSETEMSPILQKCSVPFFAGRPGNPFDIFDLEGKELTSSEVIKFLRLTRAINMDKTNRVVANKGKVARSASIEDIGRKAGFTKKTDGTVDLKETRAYINKLRKLDLIYESYNDKMDIPEYFVNPLYRRPGQRLHVDLYAMFPDVLFKAMTKVELTDEAEETREIREKYVTSNMCRDAIHLLYLVLTGQDENLNPVEYTVTHTEEERREADRAYAEKLSEMSKEERQAYREAEKAFSEALSQIPAAERREKVKSRRIRDLEAEYAERTNNPENLEDAIKMVTFFGNLDQEKEKATSAKVTPE